MSSSLYLLIFLSLQKQRLFITNTMPLSLSLSLSLSLFLSCLSLLVNKLHDKVDPISFQNRGSLRKKRFNTTQQGKLKRKTLDCFIKTLKNTGIHLYYTCCLAFEMSMIWDYILRYIHFFNEIFIKFNRKQNSRHVPSLRMFTWTSLPLNWSVLCRTWWLKTTTKIHRTPNIKSTRSKAFVSLNTCT